MFKTKGFLIIILIIISLVVILASLYMLPSQSARRAVGNFYEYEQEGEFSESWELFHPLMKEKFDKGHYLQDRAHVFMNHFGVTTFTFSLEGTDKVKKWSMEEGSHTFKLAYSTTVSQTFKGKYGTFHIQQEVFAVREKGEWKLLWDYNK
ncbi:hypothetical protein [Halobacillus sp. Marseille-Q1614]|uniref:hypothetical protein n=1 Tax=Halobacillus sp. Marseille-Q1614 TaxID=2709134 RepID=UPI00156DDB13|nr:hypothetical protein [Halobacillus sp. Marseille-Q1614]